MGSGTLILLDTHALIWLDQDDPALGPVTRQRIASALQTKTLAVSAISFWMEIPVDGEIGITAVHLDHLHGDPADRIITATALLREGMLITADRKLLEWPGQLDRQNARL